MDYSAEYGFEYQGICSRMVLTPQTVPWPSRAPHLVRRAGARCIIGGWQYVDERPRGLRMHVMSYDSVMTDRQVPWIYSRLSMAILMTIITCKECSMCILRCKSDINESLFALLLDNNKTSWAFSRMIGRPKHSRQSLNITRQMQMQRVYTNYMKKDISRTIS